jgi:divalent metal cation (Fe/Co/Zn/Cd) transporter
MREYGWDGYRETFGRTSALTTLTAFTEDTVALIGLVVALVSLVATPITGSLIDDAAGAVVVGVLLLLFVVTLALENQRLMMGEGMCADVESDLRNVFESHEGVTHVDGLQTMFIGTGQALVTADVCFAPDLVTGDLDDDIQQI